MKADRRCFKFLLSIILVFCCKNSALTPEDYVKWVANPSNGLHKSKRIGDYIFDLQYKPVAFVIATELKGKSMNYDDYEARYSELQGLQYYTLKIKIAESNMDIMKYGLVQKSDYYAKVRYFSFDMQSDIYLIEAGTRYSCVLYHFERSYGMSPNVTVTCAFKQDKESRNFTKTFVLDSDYLATGPIKLQIQDSDLQFIPQMKTRGKYENAN